ncbi:TonB-dependent receptor [Sphingomonas glaciei]|uniref:TonB-dependent receptor n=1 Tax=Sphingomonas glaciei TaxID=2938948 RepID=A0ABY5MVH4_9SPHN|nr:TonB-dependent receptor [Sphingomonas glaciei]UUR08457.1 TonB-dependent receptor [Sphingomonas glaciei]
MIIELATAMSFAHAALQAAPPLAPGAEPPDGAGEIVVTGERLPRRLRDTPSSVAVIDSETIEAGGDDRIDQLLAAIPNVQQGSGEDGPAIRGQDSTGVSRGLFAFLGGTRPRVTLQVDGRAVSYYEYVSSSTPAWDIDRIEVFRSPQTTTQGRNSIAGAIFVESRDPEFSWNGRARLIAGEIGTRQASAVITGPLIRDQLAVRISGDVRRGRMASKMFDGIAGADIDRDDYSQARVKLLYRPSAMPGLRVETTAVHTRSQAPQFEAVAAPFKRREYSLPERTNGILRVTANSLTSRIILPLGPELAAEVTLSGGDANVRRFGLPGLGNTRVDNKDASIETILRWTPGGAVGLIAGASGGLNRQEQWIDVVGLGIGSGGFDDRQSSVGLFGEASWKIVPRMTLTGGLRYQGDQQRRRGMVGSPPAGIALDYRESFDAWLPKLSLTYAVSEAVNAGVLLQRAHNPGGISVSLLRRVGDPFDAERLTNLEGFVRAIFAGGRGTLSANLFANWIENSQRQLLVPVTLPNGGTLLTTEYANAPEATSRGFEAQVGWRLNRQLSARLGVGFLRTRLERTLLPNDPTLGKQFQRSPRWGASGGIDWRPAAAWRLSAQARYHGRYFSDDANSPARQVGAAAIVDLRAAWEGRRASLFGYARNAFDSFALTYLFSSTFATAEDPREAGVGVELRF